MYQKFLKNFKFRNVLRDLIDDSMNLFYKHQKESSFGSYWVWYIENSRFKPDQF